MTAKPSGCAGCPLEHKGKGFVPDTIAKRSKYLFISEAPGSLEVAKSKCLEGKPGFVLKQWGLKAVPTLQLAMERNEITFAHTLRCMPPELQGRAYPKGEDREGAERQCRQYDPPVSEYGTVVLLGDAPQRLWFREELDAEDASDRAIRHDVKGVMGRIGRVYEKDGTRYVFAPHPAYVLRQPALVQHLQESLRIASNCETMLVPHYMNWQDAITELA